LTASLNKLLIKKQSCTVLSKNKFDIYWNILIKLNSWRKEKGTAYCCNIENKNGSRGYTHFPKAFFAILHTTSLAMTFIYCIYKVKHKFNVAKLIILQIPNNKVINYLSWISLNICYIKKCLQYNLQITDKVNIYSTLNMEAKNFSEILVTAY
jgi:hypothetical protein